MLTNSSAHLNNCALPADLNSNHREKKFIISNISLINILRKTKSHILIRHAPSPSTDRDSRARLFPLSKILDTVIHIVVALVIDNTEYKSIISLWRSKTLSH